MENLNKTRLSAMGHRTIILLMSTSALLVWTALAPGQRGMGDSKGIAQTGLKPPVSRISGKLQEIRTHPCEHTTGKAELGTHLIIKDGQGRELNIHLGPASALAETVKQLKAGRRLELLGFRTDRMPANHYVAKALILGSRFIELRDSDFRPYWACSNSNDKARPRYGRAYTRPDTVGAAYYRGRCSMRLGRGRRQGALGAGPMRRCRGRFGRRQQ